MSFPPAPRVPAAEREQDVRIEWLVSNTARFVCETTKVLTSISLLVEGVVIVADHLPSHAVSHWIIQVFAGNDPSVVRALAVTPSFLAISAFAFAGGLLRYQCYRTLGRFFTLELAVHKGHKLITEGPYRYVRHPGYTAWMIGTLGVGLMPLARGSWLCECNFAHTQRRRIALTFAAVWWLMGAVGLARRVPTEERMLKTEFGEEWDSYTKRVPYRLISHVF